MWIRIGSVFRSYLDPDGSVFRLRIRIHTCKYRVKWRQKMQDLRHYFTIQTPLRKNFFRWQFILLVWRVAGAALFGWSRSRYLVRLRLGSCSGSYSYSYSYSTVNILFFYGPLSMTMTMGRGQNLSGAGAGNFKIGRLRQPCMIVLFFSLISVEGNKYAFGGVRMFLWV